MTTKEKIEVMNAYAEGKKIQFRTPGDHDWLDWTCPDEPKWNWGGCDYRIKPNGEEMDWHGHKLVLEKDLCNFCFFLDKGECPDCGNGVWVERNPSPWHAGVPTEEGWYLYEWDAAGENFYATCRADTKKELAYLRDAKRWQKIEETD